MPFTMRLRPFITVTLSLVLVLGSISGCKVKPTKMEYTPSIASEKAKELVEAKSLEQATKTVRRLWHLVVLVHPQIQMDGNMNLFNQLLLLLSYRMKQ